MLTDLFFPQKQGGVVSTERMKEAITKKLNSKNAFSFRRLEEVNSITAQLTQSIKIAEEEQTVEEERLAQLQEQSATAAGENKKLLGDITDCLTKIQAVGRALSGWRQRLQTLEEEKKVLLHGVKAQVSLALSEIKAPLQKKIDDEAEKLLALLISVNQALEECRRVDYYIPALKGKFEVAPYPSRYMFCPPLELAGYLSENAPRLR